MLEKPIFGYISQFLNIGPMPQHWTNAFTLDQCLDTGLPRHWTNASTLEQCLGMHWSNHIGNKMQAQPITCDNSVFYGFESSSRVGRFPTLGQKTCISKHCAITFGSCNVILWTSMSNIHVLTFQNKHYSNKCIVRSTMTELTW